MIADSFNKDPAQQEARVVVVVDESGSMSAARDTTIESLNAYFASLASNPGKTFVTVWKFDAVDDYTRPNHKLSRISKIFDETLASEARIDVKNYRPSGWTPLWDAVGTVISALPVDKPTLFVILTDGHENSSSEWVADAIKKLIKEREEKGWTFVYLGADLSKGVSDEAAVLMGMSAQNTMSYDKSSSHAMAETLSSATARYAGSARMTTRSFLAPDEQEIK